jgi:hypothetical protein
VPEAEKVGANADLQYVEVFDNTESAQANPADEGKPGAFNLVFQNLSCNYLWMLVHLILRYLCSY